MIPYLLFYKIVQLFLVMLLGCFLVKRGLVASQDSTLLSRLSLYLLMPAAILNAFQVELTPAIRDGLLWAFGAAIGIHILLLLIDAVYARLTHASGTERASVMYSNAANLIIPIVSFVLGEEWVIYSCAFMSVQIVLLWTHGISLFDTTKRSLRKILCNVNIIAIAAGLLMLLTGVRLPKLIGEVASSLGGMLGNVGMLIAGMMMAEINWKKVFCHKAMYRTVLMRMLICPIFCLVLIKLVRFLFPNPLADSVLLVSFLASVTPSAATVMQFSQLHHADEELAVSVNAISTLISIVTMPIFVAFYA